MTRTQAVGQHNPDGLEIDEPSFAVVRRGWDQTAVRQHLDRMHSLLTATAGDRDRTAEQARNLANRLAAEQAEAGQLRDQLGRLTEPSENVDGMSERMQWMLQLARDEADEIRRKAAMDASQITARAEESRAYNESVRTEIDAQRTAIEETREQLLATAHDDATRVRREAAEEQARLDSESVARRAKIEDEFAAAMAARRSELLSTLAKTEASSREEAERRRVETTEQARELVARAAEEAQRKVATVELQLSQMQGVRRQLAEQLGSAHIALGQLLRRVDSQTGEGPVRYGIGDGAASKPVAAGDASPANGSTSARPGPHPRPASTQHAS